MMPSNTQIAIIGLSIIGAVSVWKKVEFVAIVAAAWIFLIVSECK